MIARGRKRRLVIARGSLADGEPPFAAVDRLGAGHTGRARIYGLLLALGLHAALGAAAARQHERPPPPAPVIVHPQIQATLQAKAPPPPPVEPPRPRLPAARAEHLSRAPPAPAQAGRVIAQAPDNAPADLTSFDLVVGQGTSYAGGLSSSRGTSTKAVEGTTAKIGGVTNGAAQDLSRPAGLLRRDWSGCPWPDEAQDSDLREAAVTVRVTVGKDGALEKVDTLHAPPGGFDDATHACLSRESFRPALDVNGAPVPDTHLLVVHFVR
ncbi:MAG TPA: hypothetical protein VH083_07935 [Myxococcales bacterium]|nr:hypothetical protein [Myxococcales bacterium]